MMKNGYLLIVAFFLVSTLYGQNGTALDEKGGFQDIKLGSDVTKYSSLVFKKELSGKDIPETKLYRSAGNAYQSVGDIGIYKLEVKSFRDTIYEIKVIAEKDPNFYKALVENYGEAQYSIRVDAYVWNGKKVKLSYRSHNKKKVELIYYYKPIKSIVKAALKEDVESIADDF